MARPSTAILDDDMPPSRTDLILPRSTGSFEWGLAAVAIGATFLIMGPMSILFCTYFWNMGKLNDHGLNLESLKMIQVGSLVCVVGAEILCITGMIFGLKGMGLARQNNGPPALALTGIILSAAAAILWLIVAIDLLMIVNTFLAWKENTVQ